MADEIAVGELRTDAELGRAVGQRVASRAILRRVIELVDRMGERDAHAAVTRWLTGDGGKVPGRTALDAQAARLERIERDLRGGGKSRDAALIELARFCVEVCR